MIFPQNSGAQVNSQPEKITIEGTVTAENGELLPGANVYVENFSAGTITDNQGHYSIVITSDIQRNNFV